MQTSVILNKLQQMINNNSMLYDVDTDWETLYIFIPYAIIDNKQVRYARITYHDKVESVKMNVIDDIENFDYIGDKSLKMSNSIQYILNKYYSK